jgi:acetyl esterase/lipase
MNIDKNIVFGMYSGLALLMDVHHPAQSNGYALIVVPGSGWTSRQTYDATPLTALVSSVRFFVPKLLDAGYTLFVVNHRNGPRFQYPAAVEDVQRAVRFIRHNAGAYGVNPDRIGAVGYSSGAYLAALLGVLNTTEDTEDPDPVNRVSARVQCVVAAATPADLTHYRTPEWALFMGQLVTRTGGPPDHIALKAYRAASPVTHVTSSSAPMLLLHGDADALVPSTMAETMRDAMEKAGAPVKLILLPGGSHDFAGETDAHPDWPDFFSESVSWIGRHLQAESLYAFSETGLLKSGPYGAALARQLR